MKSRTHTLAYVKRQAKNLKKECGISHLEALDSISKTLGYANWMDCRRSLSSSTTNNEEKAVKPEELTFTNWLKRHSKRDSPLGDLARDMLDDKTWPENGSLDRYLGHLRRRGAYYRAINTLERAWKTYKAYLARMDKPRVAKPPAKTPSLKRHDDRRITYVHHATPIHFRERTAEKFVPGDKAWISWNGKKAIPVTITEVDDRHYSFRIERPLKTAGSVHFLFLDEVRSTPELACRNYVTN